MKDLMIHNVKEKLEKEMPPKVTGNNSPEVLIAAEVKNALISFCEQEGKLAEAIIKCTKNFKECLKSIVADMRVIQKQKEAEEKTMQKAKTVDMRRRRNER